MGSLADQVSKAASENMRSTIFKAGVKFKNMSGKGAIVFRILPAFDMNKTIKEGNETFMDPMGYLPFRLENGLLTDWASLVYIARFIGHGTYKAGTRRDCVVWETFDPALSDSCPYMSLYRRAQQDPDFKAMVTDIKSEDGKTIIERAALSRPALNMVCNLIDINESEKGVVLGLFSTSSAKSLISAGGSTLGLADQRASNSSPEQIKANYLMEWAMGDLTDPQNGPVLVCTKGTDKGDMSGYSVTLALDVSQRVRRWPVKPLSLLEYRYNLPEFESYLVKQEAEDMIKGFVQTFNMRLANGMHEYALLNEVFGGIYGNLIPKPPTAPAASSTVQGVDMSAGVQQEAPRPMRHAVATPKAAVTEQPPKNNEDVRKDDQIPGVEMPSMTPGGPIKSFDRAAFLNRIKPK